MQYKKYNGNFIRNKILLPIANKLIDTDQHTVRVISDGVKYEARYYRTRYWYDSEPITIRGILEKRRVHHVSYWDGGEKGMVWCQMFGRGPDMIYARRRDNIKALITQNLYHVIDNWLEHVVKPSKEKETKKPDFTNYTGDDYEN